MTVDEVENCIIQGQPLGIYVYIIRISGSCSCLQRLCEVMSRYEDCAFMILVPDCLLSAADLKAIKKCTNTMFLFPSDTQSALKNTEVMRSQKSLYGIYAFYGNDDAAEWCSGRKTASLLRYSPAFALLVSDDTANQRCCRRVARYCRSERIHPEYPIVLFDAIGDSMMVYRTVSEDRDGIYLEILENGDIKTATEIFTDFRHTVSLKQIFEMAIPKTDSPKTSSS